MNTSDAEEAIKEELRRESEAKELRETIPGMAKRFVNRRILGFASSTHDVKPHRFAQQQSAWRAGAVMHRAGNGEMYSDLLVTQMGAMYLQHNGNNWRGRIVQHQHRLDLTRCNLETLRACTRLLSW